jgi:alanine dehydrogenase
LYTYLHLAPDLAQTEALMKSGCSAIAYETVTDDKGQLPLLAPMSEVAGRLSIQAGAHSLEKAQGGRGVLLGGVPGVPSANVVVIGGGVVGLKELDDMFASKIRTIYSTHDSLLECLKTADLVIGAVLLPGAAAPKLIKREHLKLMPEGSVIVDVAIDQGGCTETSKPTTHEAPTYVVDGVVHYCVTNMPGNAARTSTMALNNATLPYALELADKGLGRALSDNPHLRNGLNVHQGKVTCPAVAKAHGMETVAA